MIVAAIPFGVLAICISRALYTQIAVLINTYYTGKLYGLGYREQVRDFIKYLLYSAIAVSPAFFLTFTETPSIVLILLGSIISILTYYILIKKDPIFTELMTLLKLRKENYNR